MSLHQFQFIKELGNGSFATVFKVIKNSDQKIYAIKQVKLMNLNSKESVNALNQIRLLASIKNPYVISYKQAFVEENSNLLCLVMEYADGGDLKKLIEENKQNQILFKETFVWKTAFQLLLGIEKLHHNNIIHRDIKPANIFFVHNIPKLGDLNVSKVLQNDIFAQTQAGTPYYTSPQIWKNQPYGPKCDIWSLGCVIYEMCSFSPPFRAHDFIGLYKKISQGQFDRIPKQYSNRLMNFIQKCLYVDINKRLSASQLLKLHIFDKFYQQSKKDQTNEINEIKLLQPIKIPKVLTQLNQNLPESQYIPKPKKKVVIEQQIDFQQENQATHTSKFVKSLRFIKSEKNIPCCRRDQSLKKMKEQYTTINSNFKGQQLKKLEHFKLPAIKSLKNINIKKQNHAT